MKVNVCLREYKDVFLSDEDVLRITIETIRSVYGLGGSDTYIYTDHNGKKYLAYDVKYHTWETEYIREATESDLKAFEMINYIKEFFKNKGQSKAG